MCNMKIRRPYTTATIWSSGKIVCTGATRYDIFKCPSRGSHFVNSFHSFILKIFYDCQCFIKMVWTLYNIYINEKDTKFSVITSFALYVKIWFNSPKICLKWLKLKLFQGLNPWPTVYKCTQCT